jgi:hypothetical protein
MQLTVVRITINKSLTADDSQAFPSKGTTFGSEYLVQTQASFPSPQLAAYATAIAQAESRLFYSGVRFERANVKLATPGASSEELRGQFSQISLKRLRGQLEMDEDDALAYPTVTAVFARQTTGGRCGRLLLPHVLTAVEWNLYAQKQVRPLRFQRQSDSLHAPSSLFSHELLEAIRGAGGTYIMPSTAGDEPGIRRVTDFVFTGFDVSTRKTKRKKKTAIGSARRRLDIDGIEAESGAATRKSAKGKEVVPGVVYLVKSGTHFKIGKSIVFEKRLRYIKLQMPEPVEEVHVIQAANPSEVESYWHRRFAPLRLNGEWFRLTDVEVNEFKSVFKM